MRMFKRADSKNETEVKKQDVKGRKRKIIFNMRVTEDERDQINQRAALSGLLKQEFCIQSLMHQKVPMEVTNGCMRNSGISVVGLPCFQMIRF